MRARYYEPGTGRFVSEDPDRTHGNWYAFASNNPICRTDRSGRDDYSDDIVLAILWEEYAHEAFGTESYFMDNPFLEGAMDEFNGWALSQI